ncbi:MAG: fluoride efflux transporter CrcB [Candidatus Thermoplasmatota archaeon]|nr:fluoride efflux transporter CrcB [Candidatus Thermoplasmatota archaeon]
MRAIISVALGGATGALMRYGVSLLTHRFWKEAFPLGTLIINLSGCFIIGLLGGMVERTSTISAELKLFLFMGILGAFTTFSTFGLETAVLFQRGEAKVALLNILLSNLLGIGLVFAGFAISRYLVLAK